MDRSLHETEERLVQINAGAVALEGNLSLPRQARAVVLFAHGSGSSRHSPRNRSVARLLNTAHLGTLLIDLLTSEEEAIDLQTAHLRFDIPAERPEAIGAVVSRGGRPDLAGPALAQVSAPTLLIVGGNDDVVIELNQAALAQLRCKKQLVIIPGATHLFEEPGALEEVARLAREWLERYLTKAAPHSDNRE